MRVLDLFSGIGGFSLGLERAGMETVAFCEYDEKCRQVLSKHWPNVPQYTDVRTLTAEQLKRDKIQIDAICGGFPCQDISVGGKGAGLDGERSGLWFEFKRLIGDLRPGVVYIENVAALLVRGLERVLCDLASLGYSAWWSCVPASHVGSIQNRDRVWIVAYLDSDRMQRFLERLDFSQHGQGRACGQEDLREVYASPLSGDRWPQPIVRGGRRQFPNWVDRIKQLGNSVDPEIPYILGRASMS